MCKALDGLVGFAAPHFDPAATTPSPGQVRINQQCSLKEGSAIIEVSDDMGERPSRGAEGASIVIARLERASGKPSSFGNLLLLVDDPARPLASAKTICGCGIRSREIRIKFDGLVEQTEGLLISLPGPFVSICPSTKKQVVGVEAI